MQVQGVMSLLRDSSPQLVNSGLQALLLIVDKSWPVIANQLKGLIDLTQHPSHGQKASLLCSKLHFHLKQYQAALQYALEAGPAFISTAKTQHTECILKLCVSKYIQSKISISSGGRDTLQPKIKQLVQDAIRYSIQKKQHKLILGIAIQCSSMDLIIEVAKLLSPSQLMFAVQSFLSILNQQFKLKLLDFVLQRMEGGKYCTKQNQFLTLLGLYRLLDRYQDAAKIIYQQMKLGNIQRAFTIALQASQAHGFVHKIMQSLPIQPQWEQQRQKLVLLLQGKVFSDLYSVFLTNNCQTDPHYLNRLKAIEPKNSLAHSSAILGISFLQAYTQDDSFIKIQQNLQWVSKANLWGKFNCTSSLGLIHQGTKLPPLEVFKNYLHQQNPDGKQPYMVGGALYGLGLLTAGKKSQQIINYCLRVIQNPILNSKQPIIHGACLCLGLTAFASADLIIYQKLKNILDTDTAVTSQSAALAIGLIMAGTSNQQVLADLLSFESEHDKINLAICQAIALLTIEKPNRDLINGLQNSQTIKRAIPLHLAASYFGTSNPKAVKQLLNLSSDISNQIKRTAVISLGFVLHNSPQLLNIMKMMSSSYNPHIRYGLCIALAIGGPLDQGDMIADLIWPYFNDTTQFVKQGAFLSIAILSLNGAISQTKVSDFRKIVQSTISKKHEDILVRMGAILSLGIIDAGGRNMKISLTSSIGTNVFALASMLIFTDFWHWYPLINFLGLTFSPAVLIGIDNEFRIPLSFNWKCQTKPSTFSYPAMIQKQQKKQQKKSNMVELSTAKRMQSKGLQKKDSSMEVEQQNKQKQHKQNQNQKQKEEPTSYIMKNASRVLDKQTKYITWIDNRFIPLMRQKRQGIIFLKDTQPNIKQQYLGRPAQQQPKPPSQPLPQIIETKEDQMPQGFIYQQ